MLERDELQKRAREDCLKHARTAMSGELLVELLEPDLEWDPVVLRHVFDQPMVIWRRFSEFDVIVDDAGQAVGFVDSGNAKDCAPAHLDTGDALDLIRATGWLSSSVEAAGNVVQEADGSAVVAVKDPLRPKGSQSFSARLNPAKLSVIAIVPSDLEIRE